MRVSPQQHRVAFLLLMSDSLLQREKGTETAKVDNEAILFCQTA